MPVESSTVLRSIPHAVETMMASASNPIRGIVVARPPMTGRDGWNSDRLVADKDLPAAPRPRERAFRFIAPTDLRCHSVRTNSSHMASAKTVVAMLLVVRKNQIDAKAILVVASPATAYILQRQDIRMSCGFPCGFLFGIW